MFVFRIASVQLIQHWNAHHRARISPCGPQYLRQQTMPGLAPLEVREGDGAGMTQLESEITAHTCKISMWAYTYTCIQMIIAGAGRARNLGGSYLTSSTLFRYDLSFHSFNLFNPPSSPPCMVLRSWAVVGIIAKRLRDICNHVCIAQIWAGEVGF